ncbi:uncharacterized protein LOC126667110 [Mercurialis annua]|uniref:uncharacterized protein LOC126667110 n=1 Tax=Mercurialis annua TaxID=3986 RepID=UPI00215E4148|nr:uncharacterized protein LOC126667110 [Mercurialis annua]
MDSFDDDIFEPLSSPSPSCSSKSDEKQENVHHLLEEGWFFGELLASRKSSKMLRCYSDLTPNFDQKSLSSSPKKAGGGLSRAPSLPPCIGRRRDSESFVGREGSKNGVSKLVRQFSDQCLVKQPKNDSEKTMTGKMSKHKLVRTPSLPHNIGRDENDDSDTRMSTLIRQAMPNSTQILPPRHTSKGMAQSYSMPKYRPPRNWKNKTLNEVPKFTDKKQDLEPSADGILVPGLNLQDNKKTDEADTKNKAKKGYYYHVYEARQVQQSCAPPIPIWAASQNSAEDMKMQLKYWARAVASNVR